jgi:ParB family chromosome partitioning protein
MALESNSIFWVEVEKISPNPFQPRREFDESRLRELAESVRMYGVLQPLVVTRKEVAREDGGLRSEYELIAGERRLRASKLAGLKQVPVIIRTSDESDRMKLELAIIENLQREDLNPVDRALAFRQLADQFTLSHSQVAQKVGRSREYVSNTLRLLLLPEDIISAIKRGEITEGHGRALLMLAGRPAEMQTLFREIVLKKLSVREVERISRKIATDKVRKKEWNIDPELIEIEKQFTDTLGTRVQILRTDFGGKLTIDYFSQDDLRKILDVIAEGKQHVGDTPFTIPELPVHAVQTPAEPLPPMTEAAQTPAEPLAPMMEATPAIETAADVATIETMAEETVAQVTPASSEVIEKPADDRTHDEQKTMESKDMADDPDLYAIKHFSL